MQENDNTSLEDLPPFKRAFYYALATGLIIVTLFSLVSIEFALQAYALMLVIILSEAWAHGSKIRQWLVVIISWVFVGAYLVVTHGWMRTLVALPKLCGVMLFFFLVALVARRFSWIGSHR